MVKYRHVIILTIVLLSNLVPGNAQGDLFEQANIAYTNGDYLIAANLLETIVENDIHNATIYFNLGNAYFQAGDLGNAMLNYQRAYQLNPRDDSLKINITRVRAFLDNRNPEYTDILSNVASLTSDTFTVNQLGWILFLFWSIFFTILLLYIVAKKWRTAFRYILILYLIGIFIGIGLYASRLYFVYLRPNAVVIQEETIVFSGPSTNYLKHFELDSGIELRILEEENGWIKFILPNGQRGWVEAQAVAKV